MGTRGLLRQLALVPATILVAGGCFATRGDMQILQNDLASLRAQNQQADSIHRVQLDHVIEQLAAANDSLNLLNERTTKSLGDVRGDLYSMSQQLIQIQQLTGQSQTNLQKLRAQLEEHAPAAAPLSGSGVPMASTPVPTSGAAGDTSHVAGAGPAGPGPNELFQLALDQLHRGSTQAARDAFQDLLQKYPTADIAPDAQFYLAEADEMGGQTAAADSGYQLVVARYPTSPRAPTALYKHATILEASGKTDLAKASFQDVVNKYPQSDEAVLARDRLRELK
jgi:tol-pal system protein YbgF